MPPLAILNNRAFLVSPLEIPVYLLELPDMKDALLEGEIRNRLKALYPGDPENTVIDYTLCPGAKKTADRAAVVYVSSRQTSAMYRGLQRPLVPGTAVMGLAMRRTGAKSAFCVIATEEWVEAAVFEGAHILRYGSCPAPSGSSGELPFSFIASFVNSGGSGPAAALFIRAGSSNEQNEKTEKLLLKFFNPVTALDINEIALKGNLKRLGIFNDSRRRSLALQKNSAGALLFLNGVSLLLSLHIAAGRTKLELSQLEKQEREQGQVLDRAKALEREIAELLASGTAARQGGRTDPYGIIAGLQRCLSGGWIKSLVIQGENFDLEAEGADSIGVLQSLQASGLFSELSLRRASNSPIAGDQFIISGRAGSYEKK
jgi:hypothetical protein